MYEWKFTPDANDIAANRGVSQPCRSGYTFKTEKQAIANGKRFLKETSRTGTITAVKHVAERWAVIADY